MSRHGIISFVVFRIVLIVVLVTRVCLRVV